MENKSQVTESSTENKEQQEPKDLFVCSTPKCKNPSAMQCPTCIKMGMTPSYFCSQECFKEFWPIHKLFHQKSNELTNPI